MMATVPFLWYKLPIVVKSSDSFFFPSKVQKKTCQLRNQTTARSSLDSPCSDSLLNQHTDAGSVWVAFTPVGCHAFRDGIALCKAHQTNHAGACWGGKYDRGAMSNVSQFEMCPTHFDDHGLAFRGTRCSTLGARRCRLPWKRPPSNGTYQGTAECPDADSVPARWCPWLWRLFVSTPVYESVHRSLM